MNLHYMIYLFQTCILCVQVKTVHIMLDTIPPVLFRYLLPHLIYFQHHTVPAETYLLITQMCIFQSDISEEQCQ